MPLGCSNGRMVKQSRIYETPKKSKRIIDHANTDDFLLILSGLSQILISFKKAFVKVQVNDNFLTCVRSGNYAEIKEP